MSKAPEPNTRATAESPSSPTPENDTDPVITCVEYLLVFGCEPEISEMEMLPPASTNRVASAFELLPPEIRGAVQALLRTVTERESRRRPLC